MTAREVRLTAYTDSTGFGGAEVVLSTILAGLSSRFQVTVAGVDEGLVRRLVASREGATTVVLPRPAGKLDARGVLAQLSAVRRLRPEILLANLWHPFSAQYALAAGNLTPGVRTVAVLHSFLVPSRRRQLLLNRPNLRRVDRFVSVSGAVARMVEETIGIGAPLRVIPNGVADRPAAPRERAGARPLIGSVGRLSKEKGQDLLLRALPELPGVDCVLVGAGPERASLERLARGLGVGERVELTGWVDNQLPWLAAFDVFVQPSRNESAPLAVIEAMLARRPVVAARVGGLPEVVVQGRTGLLVDPGNPLQIAQAVGELLSDPDRRAEMGASARAIALERFSAEAMVDAYEELLAELAG